ncbi:dihydropteridine reductase [Bacillus cereus]|uniref:penicillin-binding protein n=1 Tax=Bacillus cereus TaxID=1396 RepID=UPI000BF35BEE|nr:penicillin-binding protein [Bacillus cereus]PER08589.1 dihydropteridine reductase [Bacillus cereus]PEW57180.1 dihydropteridine reductase [Bacillus cereus]PEX57265.1 dihydropteridine reductase [Bacillus cereus]PEZ91879.1 dihydropteridine reductase [Bacillus cereus]PFF01260.1 dihydropteridine reductase [Bacillus cereus]
MQKLQTNKGARYMMIAFIVLFLIMILRIVYIQAVGVVHNVNVKDLADEQHNKKGVLEANRGTIYDQTGKVLVQDSTTYRVVVNLKGKDKVKNKDETAQQLADALEIDKEEVLKNFHEGRTQVEIGKIGRNLSREKKEKINDLKIPGVSFMSEKARVYPNEDFASYILGFARPDDKGNTEGKFGLEKSLDKYLRSTNGNIEYVGTRRGIPLTNDIGKVEPAKNGNNVYLTLDKQINSFLEEAMNKAQEHYDPSMLIGIIADPKTGKVLAMASKPSYNPNVGDIEYFLNDPIANAYEPGSTMKVFTLAAAINEGVYNGKEYFQSGKYSVGFSDIKDHNGGFGWGSITFDEGFERSSNVAFSILEDQLLKPNKFKQYMNKFGFNQKTGIDLPGESKNTLLLNTQIQQVTTSFGQGSTVTPIQLIQAATAIANDGKMMQPYIVDKVVNPTNKEVIMENQPKEIGNPIKKVTADKVRSLMERVITSSKGTGTMYKVDGYPIGGKTGTAQIPNPENGRYMEGKENYIFSFLGMAPIDDPELIVYLAIKQPKLKGDEYGAQPLAEIFKPVIKNSLEYLKVKPYTEKQIADAAKQSQLKVQNYVNQSMGTAEKSVEKEKLQPVILGEGKIIKQYPQSGEVMSEGDRIFLLGNNAQMPNVKGWSMRDVMYFSKLLKLDLKTSGTGYVTSQSIEKGQDLHEGDTLELELEPPLQPLTEANTN